MGDASVPAYSFRHNHPKDRTGAFKIPHLVRKQKLKRECGRRSRLRLIKLDLEHGDDSEDEMPSTITRCGVTQDRKPSPLEWVLLEAGGDVYNYPSYVWYDLFLRWWT